MEQGFSPSLVLCIVILMHGTQTLFIVSFCANYGFAARRQFSTCF